VLSWRLSVNVLVFWDLVTAASRARASLISSFVHDRHVRIEMPFSAFLNVAVNLHGFTFRQIISSIVALKKHSNIDWDANLPTPALHE